MRNETTRYTFIFTNCRIYIPTKKIVWIKSTEALFHRFVAFMFTASVSDEMQTSKKLARKIHWMLGFDLKKKNEFPPIVGNTASVRFVECYIDYS